LEIRALKLLETTPGAVGFPGVRLAARLETRVRRKGKWAREVVYLISSLSRDRLEAKGMLQLKRRYWVIESRLHHSLDVTMREDFSRVRTSNSARVLCTTRRVILSLSNAVVDRARKKNPKTKYNTNSFCQKYRSANGGRERLHALLFAKQPNVLDLAN